jgi:hypothetical protein
MPDPCPSRGQLSNWHQWVTVDSRISHVEMSRMDLQGTRTGFAKRAFAHHRHCGRGANGPPRKQQRPQTTAAEQPLLQREVHSAQALGHRQSRPPRGRPAMPAPCTTPQLAGSVASSGILATPRLAANVETPRASTSYLSSLASIPCCTSAMRRGAPAGRREPTWRRSFVRS